METKEIIDLLDNTDIFRGVPRNLIPNLASHFSKIQFKAGETIVKQDQRVNTFYLVSKGRFEIYRMDKMGTQTHIAYLVSGDCLGTIHLLYDHPSTIEVIAIQDSECNFISKEDFLKFLEIDPEISHQILRSIIQHIYKTNIYKEAALYKEKAIQFLQENKRISQFSNLIGLTPQIKEVNKAIERIARNNEPVLIEGEYGTGKELISSIIHNKSKRSKKPFISVDCEKLVPGTIESQLFGNSLFHHTETVEYFPGLSYFELAEGGTILLKNIELLPLRVQVKIQELLSVKQYMRHKQHDIHQPDVRIIATTRIDLEKRLTALNFDQRLFQILSKNKVYLPPLRERKKDIPLLVDHLIKKYSEYYGKQVIRVSSTAMSNLLAHDYKLGNTQEMEEIISRGVSLTRTDTVRSEHLFLGLPASKPLVLFNLLKINKLLDLVKKRIFPEKIREIIAITFILIIVLSLFSHYFQYPYNTLGRFLTWSIWWPAMFISFFFIGRFWCSVCPYATYSHFAKKIVKFELNFPFKRYDYLFMTIGFLFVIWIEEVSFMRDSSFKVGLLQLSIVSIAVIVGVLYKRDTWCRYICPLGALISTCSMSSIVELRSNTDICINKCATHDCYKGNNNNPGCPMFQFLMYVDNNQTCKMCMSCVRSCPNKNIALNIRPPAAEIYYSNQLNKGLYLFVIALMGLLIPILLMHKIEMVKGILSFTFFYLLTPIIIFALLWLINMLGFKSNEQSIHDILWRSTYAYIPLALACHIAYQLQFLPIVSNFLFSVQLSPSISTNIIIYSKTLFLMFKVIYYLLEFILFFKLSLYLFLKFKSINFKESKSVIIKPILGSIIITVILYYIPKINNFVFSALMPTAESKEFPYKIKVFHVFQLFIIIFGIVLSVYCMYRILNKKARNIKKNSRLLLYHLLFMLTYGVFILYLLII